MTLLKDKVAIITGAASGIGKATAQCFIREGAIVILSDINDADGKAVTEELRKDGGSAIYLHANTASAEDNEKLVREAVDRYGKLDIAVNNAGIGGPLSPTGDYPLEGWRKVIEVNLTGVFYGMRYQIPAMIASGGGSIVNISSILGQVGTQGAPAYTAAKHGLVGLSRTAALDHARQGVRVNAVGPGYIKTPLLTANLDEATMAAIAEMHPIGRLGEDYEVAELILWLASDKASFVTGNYYAVDGGYLAK